MKRYCGVTVVVGIGYYALALSTHIAPTMVCVFLSFVLLAALVISLLIALIVGFSRWRHSSRLWPIPALVCLVVILGTYLTPPIGRVISDRLFKRHYAEYSNIVRGLKDGTIPCPFPNEAKWLGEINVTRLPAQIRDIRGANCSDGGVVVYFRLDTRVPFLHEGYFFKGYGDSSNCNFGSMAPAQNWRYIRHVTGRWYHFSDQPGL